MGVKKKDLDSFCNRADGISREIPGPQNISLGRPKPILGEEVKRERLRLLISFKRIVVTLEISCRSLSVLRG